MPNIEDMKGKPPATVADMRPKDQIAHLLDRKRGEITKMLPKHLTLDRLLKVATIAATTTPALAECDVPSLVGAIAQCAQMGLEPNTVLGHAYLVPFNTKRGDRWVKSVQVIIGYRGLIDLARRSGQIVSIAAHEVCEHDEFDLAYGITERLEHKPKRDGDRGRVVGFYAVAHLVGGGYAFDFMSVHQVEEIRNASQGYQQAVKYQKEASHPWKVHFVEMGRKTAIRRLAKYLPLSIELATATALDDKAAAGVDQGNDAFTIDGDFAMVPGDAATEGGDTGAPMLSYAEVSDALNNAKSLDDLNAAADLIRTVGDAQQQTELASQYENRVHEMENAKKPPRGTRGAME